MFYRSDFFMANVKGVSRMMLFLNPVDFMGKGSKFHLQNLQLGRIGNYLPIICECWQPIFRMCHNYVEMLARLVSGVGYT